MNHIHRITAAARIRFLDGVVPTEKSGYTHIVVSMRNLAMSRVRSYQTAGPHSSNETTNC